MSTATGPGAAPATSRLPWDLVAAAGLAALVGPASVRLVTGGDLPGGWTTALVAVIVLAHLSVFAGRWWPVGSFAVASAAALLLVLAPALRGQTAAQLGAPVPPILVPSSLAFSAALYRLAARSQRRTALLALGVTAAGAVLALIRLWGLDEWSSGVPTGLGWRLYLVLGLAGAGVLPWALGRWRATRAAYIRSLQDRADEAERRQRIEAELAVGQERRRIAREMHDVLAHSLAVIIGQADGGRLIAEKDPARAAEALTTVAATSREAMADVRALLGLLSADEEALTRPPQPGLGELAELVRRVRDSGLDVELKVVGAVSVRGVALEHALYRLVQESLTNVVKHAGRGATASVLVRLCEESLEVSVTDDGRGVHHAARPGLGLTGMMERFRLLGGWVAHGPRPAGGFAVQGWLPVPREVSREESDNV